MDVRTVLRPLPQHGMASVQPFGFRHVKTVSCRTRVGVKCDAANISRTDKLRELLRSPGIIKVRSQSDCCPTGTACIQHMSERCWGNYAGMRRKT